MRIAVHLGVNGAYWVARWREPGGKPRSRGLGPQSKRSRRDATAECRRIEAELAAGTLAPGQAPTLEQWVEHHRATRHVASSTAIQIDTTIDKYILPHFGGQVRMDRVTIAATQRWVAWLRERPGVKSELTIAGHVRMAKALWNAAHKAHGVPNPFSQLAIRAVTPLPEVPDLSDADIGRLVDACPTPAWKALVGLCAFGGLRRGEALLIDWQAVQWADNRLLVPQPKTAGSTDRPARHCLMESQLARILQEVQDSQAGPLLAQVPQRNLHRDMRKIIGRAGLSPWRKPFHGLRKWRSSTWKRVYPAAVVDAWLGHGAEVARRSYYGVPEHFYGGGGLPEIEQMRREIEQLKAQIQARSESAPKPAQT